METKRDKQTKKLTSILCVNSLFFYSEFTQMEWKMVRLKCNKNLLKFQPPA